MNKFSVRSLLTITLVLITLGPASARDNAQLKELGVTCRDVLRMGQEKFCALFESKKPGGNVRHAVEMYAHCRHADNDARARALSPGMRKQFAALRNGLEKWEEGGRTMGYALSGGGTMHLDFAAEYDASRADALGGLIPLLKGPEERNPFARARSSKAIAAAESLLAKLKKRRGEVEGKEYQDIYDRSLADWKSGLAKVKACVRSLPDDAAGKVAPHVVEVVKWALPAKE